MMRRLTLTLLAMVAMTVVCAANAAEDLIKYVPNGADGLVSVNVAAILNLPMLEEARKENPEFKANWEDFEQSLKTYGLTTKDLPTQALIFFTGDKSLTGVLMQTTITEEKLVNLLTEQQKKQQEKFYSIENIGGRKVFVVKSIEDAGNPALQKLAGRGEDIAITYIKPDVALLTDKNMLNAALSGMKDNAGTVKKLEDGVKSLNRNAVAWLYFKNPDSQAAPEGSPQMQMDPLQGMETVGVSLDLTGQNKKDVSLEAEVCCKDQNAAAMMAMQVNGITMMVLPSMFAKDPKLSSEVAQAISIKPEGSKLKASVKVPEELNKKIGDYMKANRPQFGPGGAACAPGAPCPAPTPAPAIQ